MSTKVEVTISLNDRVRSLVIAIETVLGRDESEQASVDVLTAALLTAYVHGTDPEDVGRIVRAASAVLVQQAFLMGKQDV